MKSDEDERDDVWHDADDDSSAMSQQDKMETFFTPMWMAKRIEMLSAAEIHKVR